MTDPCNNLFQHFGADGSFIKQYATPAGGMSIAPDGSIWILGGLGISHYTADFGLIASSGIYADTFTFAADGTAWMIQTTSVSSQSNPLQISSYRTLTHVKADGSVISTYQFNVIGDITQTNTTGQITFTKLAVQRMAPCGEEALITMEVTIFGISITWTAVLLPRLRVSVGLLCWRMAASGWRWQIAASGFRTPITIEYST